MKPTVSQYARALLTLSQEASASEQKEVVKNFVELLKRRREIKKIPAVLRRLEQFLEEASGAKRVQAISARPLNEKEVEEIVAQAQEIFGVKKIILEERVKPEIQGGILLKTDNEMVDVSMKSRVTGLRKLLTK
jgi:F-type H+-transporting ATPase subunit delta